MLLALALASVHAECQPEASVVGGLRMALSKPAVPVEDERWRVAAARIDAWMDGPTWGDEERAIVATLAAMSPEQRRLALREVDRGADKRDLDELVFHDVDDPALRSQLLALIAESGAHETELGIISDFDDTVYPHKDHRHGTEFPGARAFYAALEGEEPGDLHFVTGRPPIATGKMRGRIQARGLPPGTIEGGDLSDFLFKGEDGIRDEKLDDLERLVQLHPGQRFVLIGDDSQRDPEVYDTFRARHPEAVAAVVIRRTGLGKEDERDGLIYVDDYVQALAHPAIRTLLAAR